jgi:anti-anti-sigma factor
MSTVKVFEPDRVLSSVDGARLIDWVSDTLASGVQVLLVDLRKTSFMDSSGLGALVVAMKRVRENNGKFALCSVGGQARMLLELASMEKVFDIYTDRTDFNNTLDQ